MDFSKLSINKIAIEVFLHMKETEQKAPAAKPYLDAMLSLETVEDFYGLDDGRMIIAYFLANARSLKGDKMREIRKELNKRIK